MRGITKTDTSVAKEWARGKITHAEASRRLKKTSVGTYVVLARALREIVKTYESK